MDRPYRVFISTGEVSGDLQGSLLIPALLASAKARGYTLEILALGGPKMAAAGARILGDTSKIGAIGPINALPFIWPTLALQRQVARQLETTPPDLTVLIDYVGPNLRLGQQLKQTFSSSVVYYIAPPEWVWSQGPGVTRQLVNLCEQMLAIFPQEAKYFAEKGANVQWIGHPLLDQLPQFPTRQQARQQLGLSPQQPMIALMPASRKQELRLLLPIILSAARQILQQVPDIQFWLPLALTTYRNDVTAAIRETGLPIHISQDSHTVLAAADVVIAKSGTANIEAALLNIPQVVFYRVGAISGWLYQHLLKFKVDFISPINLVAGKEIVPELLQQEVSPKALSDRACSLLADGIARQKMLMGYQEVRKQLGHPGVLQRAADIILDTLEGIR